MKIVFMGTPDFAVPTLEAVINKGHQVVAVYCQPDKPQGRHFTLTAPPVKEAAVAHGIPVYQPQTLKDESAVAELAALSPEIIIVAAYGKLLPKAVLDIPKRGCINVHASLLPKYRGAAPIQWAVINGEKETGVTIMQMAEGMDTGDILFSRSTEIGRDETAGELFDRLAVMGAKALCDVLDCFDMLKAQKQNDSLASWASPLKKETGEIDWHKSAEEVYSLIRGVTPWPGAYTTFCGKRLKVYKARLGDKSGAAGNLLDNTGLIIGCREGSIELLEVQLEGAKRITAADFIRGKRLREGKLFD